MDQPEHITIDTFAAVDLRAARVLECEEPEGSRALLRFVVDLGPMGERQIFAGIKEFYDPKELIGSMVVVVANLTPRKMKLGVSEGMILCAGDTPKVVRADGAAPGSRIR